MRKIMLCDLVIAKDWCNASCDYCLTGYNQLSENKLTYIKSEYCYEEGTILYKNLNQIVHNLKKNFNIAALKISGGEILLIPKIIDFLKENSKYFLQLQLMTNGILLNEKIVKQLVQIPNIYLHVSLDSSIFEGNFYRTKNRNLHDRILKNIDYAAKIGIPIEVNCVLNDKSIIHLVEFLDYLKRYDKYNLKISPFPIRGDEANMFSPKNSQIEIIDLVIENYEIYRQILPPLSYLIYLKNFLFYGRREANCYIPFHTFQIFEDGTMTPCPFWWTVDLGNMLDDAENISDNFTKPPIYRLFQSKSSKLSCCKTCFVHTDVLNLYFSGILSIYDLRNIPFYSSPAMAEFCESLKSTFCT